MFLLKNIQNEFLKTNMTITFTYTEFKQTTQRDLSTVYHCIHRKESV